MKTAPPVMRRMFYTIVPFFLTAVTLASAPSLAGRDDANQPNFIVILTDDQRADAMSCSGNPHIRTPHIDALAEQGLRFTNAFVTTSICSPSRAALLTGRYGSVNGVQSLADPALAAGEKTWPQALRSAGYRTAHIGKWHLSNSPQSLGFDEAVYFVSNGSYTGRTVRERRAFRVVEGHIDQYVVDQAVAFLGRSAEVEAPFALMICTQVPHMDNRFQWNARPETRRSYRTEDMPVPASWTDDLSGKPPYLQQARSRVRAVEEYGYDRRERVQEHLAGYYAAITDLDAALGRVLQAASDLGLAGDTYIIFTSDNGWLLGEHGFTSKVLAYEESIRVPLIIAGPGIMAGTDTRLVLNIDLAPTILRLAHVPVPDQAQGKSLIPANRGRGGALWRTDVVYEAMEPSLGSWPLLAVRTDRWKYIQTFEPETQLRKPAFEELYDLREDPGEMQNLATAPQYRETLQRLRERLDHHRRLTAQPPD